MILTADDAARRLGISPRTIRKAAAAGRLPGAVKLGRWTWMIPEESLQAFKLGAGGARTHKAKGEE